MASFHVVGDFLLEPDEVFLENIAVEVLDNTTNRDANVVPVTRNFTEIGIGKPLSIEIATIYTGKYRKFLGGKKDAIVVSGVKSSLTFQATSRAINLQAENVNENDYLRFGAFQDGTKIVYYTPAVDSDNIEVSFEVMFDNFDTKVFEVISGLLNSAAGVPVFMPAAPYLLGGSQLINIGSKLGDAIFSGNPHLSAVIPIQFNSPIIPPTEPREFVIYSHLYKQEFDNLKIGLVETGGVAELRLIDKTSNNVYTGTAPYMIVILDGRERHDLDSFSPTLASAAMLKKFYGAPEKIGEITSALQDAMKLYNDSNYKLKGERLKKQLDKLQQDSEDYKKLKALYDAYSKNIQSENFKLPEIDNS